MVLPLLPLVPSILGVVGGIFGNRAETKNTEAANAASAEQARLARVANRHAATKGFQRDRSTMNKADRMNDRNIRQANRFAHKEARLAWDRTDEAALRNRAWAKEDYVQARADQATQYTDLRAAAQAGGFNPLSVLGTGISAAPAGGLTSSSYSAASGAGAMPVVGMGASVPMSYGAPVAVAPLSSNAAIIGAVQEFGQEITGVPAQERANAQLYSDIARIELERARAGMTAPTVPVLGRTAIQQEASAFNQTMMIDGEEWSTAPMAKPWRIDPTTGNYIVKEEIIDDSGMGITRLPGSSESFPVATFGGELLGADEGKLLAAQAGLHYGKEIVGSIRESGVIRPKQDFVPPVSTKAGQITTRTDGFGLYPTLNTWMFGGSLNPY